MPGTDGFTAIRELARVAAGGPCLHAAAVRRRLVVRGDADGDDRPSTGLTTKAMSNHVSNILAKLQVADRTQAAMKAREAGLGQPRDQA